MKIEALIISAGYSRRMKDFKPLLKFEGIPFILSIILKLYRYCERIHIVIGYRAEEIKEVLSKWFNHPPAEILLLANRISEEEWFTLKESVHCIYHPNYDQGMFSSLQAGLVYCQNTDWILYHFVDQPHIPESFYSSFTKQISTDYDWIQPCYHQQKGHPIFLNKSLFPIILKEAPSQSLSRIFKNSVIKTKLWNCPYPQVLRDFDSPLDMQPGE
jgi:molybdenum cofactor cytidylyltransferase